MLRSDFIDEIFTFFKCKDNDLKRAYDLAFTVREPIDWDKLYRIVINRAESRYLPAPKWFKDFFPRCVMRESGTYLTPDGLKVRLVLTDYVYEFETNQLNKPLEEMKLKAMRKFKDKFRSFELLDESNPIIEDEYGHKSYNWHAI